MQQKDVPQDKSIYDTGHSICYATDEEGKLVLTPSYGWGAANIADSKAWETMNLEMTEIARKVRTGQLSPIAYPTAWNLMDLKLLAHCWIFPER